MIDEGVTTVDTSLQAIANRSSCANGEIRSASRRYASLVGPARTSAVSEARSDSVGQITVGAARARPHRGAVALSPARHRRGGSLTCACVRIWLTTGNCARYLACIAPRRPPGLAGLFLR
jgi:hypothetical protein